MIKYIIIIIIIITILITLYLLKKQIKKYNKNLEINRNIKMNGFKNMSAYLPYSIHFQLFKLFKQVVDAFDKNNIKYFLSSGGLIGYFRHNKGLIPWDDDIDICVFIEDRDKINKCLIEFAKKNNYIFSEFFSDCLFKITYNDVFIDIFYIKYYEDKQYYHYNSNFCIKSFQNEYIYKDELFPLNNVEYFLYEPDGSISQTLTVSIPNKSEKFLDRAYGDWRNKYIVNIYHNVLYNLLFIDINNCLFKKIFNILLSVYKNIKNEYGGIYNFIKTNKFKRIA
jgi:phosphorylcholine metabolism protein LicD